jgi:hypothetical protein
MTDRHIDAARHFWHTIEQGLAPSRRQNVDATLGMQAFKLFK